MKLTTSLCALAAFTLAGASMAAPDAAPLPAFDSLSDKAQGTVTLTSDLVFSDGRLVLTVAARNKTEAPVELLPAHIKVVTAAGKPIPFASLEQLENETRAAFGAAPAKSADGYDKMATVHVPVVVTANGESDASANTGGESISAPVGTKRKPKVQDEANNPKLKEALDSLRAGILQGVTVHPRSTAGGNVVTQAFKFGRKEERRLKVAVDFAGERHEFELVVPPQ